MAPAGGAVSLLAQARRRLERALDALVVGLFLVMFAVVLLQVLFRYAIDWPLVWSEELSRYLFVWLALLGWTLAARRRSHIAIEGLAQRLPDRARLGIGVVVQLAVILFALLLLGFGVQMTVRSLDVPSVTLFFGFGLIYAVVPLTAVLILLYALLDLIEAGRRLRAHGSDRA